MDRALIRLTITAQNILIGIYNPFQLRTLFLCELMVIRFTRWFVGHRVCVCVWEMESIVCKSFNTSTGDRVPNLPLFSVFVHEWHAEPPAAVSSYVRI